MCVCVFVSVFASVFLCVCGAGVVESSFVKMRMLFEGTVVVRVEFREHRLRRRFPYF